MTKASVFAMKKSWKENMHCNEHIPVNKVFFEWGTRQPQQPASFFGEMSAPVFYCFNFFCSMQDRNRFIEIFTKYCYGLVQRKKSTSILMLKLLLSLGSYWPENTGFPLMQWYDPMSHCGVTLVTVELCQSLLSFASRCGVMPVTVELRQSLWS